MASDISVHFRPSNEEQSEDLAQSQVNGIPEQINKNFTVIWHNLTYKADSRPWYTKAKERFINSGSSDNVSRSESPNSSGTQTAYGNGNVGRRSKEKIILNRLCGDARSGQLTAIMGPSGAGKSSLLHCLFQNRVVGTTGRILVESQSKSKLKVCFIPQRDYMNEWLTVREDLIFVSKLKMTKNPLTAHDPLPENNSNTNSTSLGDNDNDLYVKQGTRGCHSMLNDHEANVLRVSDLLGLNNCLDVAIKNISGGQKKRLAIARELMSKPDILILDEPTTGLDSLTCLKTIMVLRDLAHLSPNPMAVVVTIHQPQREVFNLFDKTYFISNKGTAIFDDNPKNAMETIERVANLKPPVANYNPASFLIEIASDVVQGDVKDLLMLNQKDKFSQKYDATYLNSLTVSKSGSKNWKFCSMEKDRSLSSDGLFRNGDITDTDVKESAPSNSATIELGSETPSTLTRTVSTPSTSDQQYFISHQLSDCLSSHSNNLMQSFRHVFILTHRSWLSVIRNPSFTRSRLIFHTLLPLAMLIVFGNHTGMANNCPKLAAELSAQDMGKSIKSGTVAKNVEETRLTVENMSFYFILMYGFGINIISCTASFYPLTMHMFKKETINGLYSPAPYFIGQMLAELPLEIIFPFISILLAYPLSNQLPSYLEWRMFTVASIVFLVSYATHSLGLLCGSIFVNDVSLAVLSGQALLLPLVMLSGFLIRPPRMPEWMKIMSYISPFRNGMTAIVTARYGFDVCECDEDLILEEDEKIGFSGMPPNVKSVINYLFPKEDVNASGGIDVNEMFGKLGDRFVKSQTFGLDIKSCDDVKPYIMHVLNIENADLITSIGLLVLFAIVLKVITFSIMKSFPYRIN